MNKVINLNKLAVRQYYCALTLGGGEGGGADCTEHCEQCTSELCDSSFDQTSYSCFNVYLFRIQLYRFWLDMITIITSSNIIVYAYNVGYID